MKFHRLQIYFIACIEPDLFLGLTPEGNPYLTRHFTDAAMREQLVNLKAVINLAEGYNFKIFKIDFVNKKIVEVKE